MTSTEKIEIVVEVQDKASSPLSGIKGALGNVFTTAAGFVTAGIFEKATGAVMDFGKAIVDETLDAQKNQAQLESVLKSTGGAAGVTKDQALGLADALSQITTFSDDSVLSGENLLLTFTNIGGNVFPQATQTMLDMSTALGQDMKTSAIQLGKALNDPLSGMTALQRVGVTFSDAQTAVIKRMMETGDTAGAQLVILNELGKEFGGSAKAAGETFGGQLEILKNQFLNTAEAIGTEFLPIMTDGLKEITPILMDLAKNVVAFVKSEEFKQWLKDTGVMIHTVVGFIKDDLIPWLQEIGKWFNANVKPVLGEAITWLQGAWEGLWAGLQKAWDVFRPAFEGDWKQFGKNVRAVFDDVVKWFQEIDWGKLGTDLVKGIISGLTAADGLLRDALRGLGSNILDFFKGFFGISSPSKVMAGIGQNLMAGMAVGMYQGSGAPISAAAAAGNQVVSSVVNQYSLTVNSSAQSEPVVQDFMMLRALAG